MAQRLLRSNLRCELARRPEFWVRAGLFAFLASAGTSTPALAQPKAAKTVTVSEMQYRTTLEKAVRELKAMESHRPRPLGPLLKRLDTTVSVRRADGKTQKVTGNIWSKLQLSGKPLDAPRPDVKRTREIAESQLRALDEWAKIPAYQPADAGKIVANLEASGQIRTGPLWWQQTLIGAWKAVGNAWSAFWKWISGLFPTPAAPRVSAPSDQWLWGLFYLVVAAILGFILWFCFRAFGGSWGQRAVKRAAALQGEDEALLQLPPSELRSRAEIFASQGNFREALRHRYLSLLLQLDERGVWRYDARRTNWEHIALLRRAPRGGALVPALSDLTRRFDRVRYGGAPCDAPAWSQFDGDVRQFEAQSGQLEKAEAR